MPILFLKKCVSYLVPVKIETRKGDLTPVLEVTLENGRYVLNGERVNYSFGGLQEVFRRVFKKFRLGQYHFKNILVLGFGAGSVVMLLRREFGQQAPVTAVENDGVMLDIAAEYFNTTQIPGLTLVQEDAAVFVQGCTDTFDLVVIDLFIEEHIPGKFQETPFLEDVKRLLKPRGLLFFNVIPEQSTFSNKQSALQERMKTIFPDVLAVQVVMVGAKNTIFVSGLNTFAKSGNS